MASRSKVVMRGVRSPLLLESISSIEELSGDPAVDPILTPCENKFAEKKNKKVSCRKYFMANRVLRTDLIKC